MFLGRGTIEPAAASRFSLPTEFSVARLRGAVARFPNEAFVAELHLTRRQKEDPMVASWVRLQDWAIENARILLGVVGVVVAVALVGFLWMKSKADAEAKASGKLAEASALYWRGEYGPLTQRASDIRRDYPGTRAATEATRMLGDAAFWQGDFKKAATNYEEYLKKAPKDDPTRLGVERSLAQAWESDHQYQKAAETYERLGNNSDLPRLDQADLTMSAARAYEAANNVAKAKPLFEKVANNFPETPFGTQAQIRLGELEGAGK